MCFIHSREVRSLDLVLCVVLLVLQLQRQRGAFVVVAATYLLQQASAHEKAFCLGTKKPQTSAPSFQWKRERDYAGLSITGH